MDVEMEAAVFIQMHLLPMINKIILTFSFRIRDYDIKKREKEARKSETIMTSICAGVAFSSANIFFFMLF